MFHEGFVVVLRLSESQGETAIHPAIPHHPRPKERRISETPEEEPARSITPKPP